MKTNLKFLENEKQFEVLQFRKSKIINNYKIIKTQWTKEEELYLAEKWGELSVEKIALNLKRSITAVLLKKNRLKLGKFLENGDYITFNQLSNIIRGDGNCWWDCKRIINAGFPLIKKRIHKKNFKVVKLENFFKWFEKNKHLIDISRTTKGDFGLEPEWVEEKRKADKRYQEYKGRKWSETDDNKLINLLNEFKYGYRYISIQLKRTEGAIKRRMLDLKIKARPIKKDNHNLWSDEEKEIVKNMYNKGYNPVIIAEYVNRSASAINGVLERNNFYKDVELCKK